MNPRLWISSWACLLANTPTPSPYSSPNTVALVYGLKEWLLRLRWKNGCPAGDSDICRSYASFKRKKVRTTKIIREVEKMRESRVDNKRNHNCAGYLKFLHFHLNLLFLNETATAMFYITKVSPVPRECRSCRVLRPVKSARCFGCVLQPLFYLATFIKI